MRFRSSKALGSRYWFLQGRFAPLVRFCPKVTLCSELMDTVEVAPLLHGADGFRGKIVWSRRGEPRRTEDRGGVGVEHHYIFSEGIGVEW